MKKIIISCLLCTIISIFNANLTLAKPCRAEHVPELLPPGAKMQRCSSEKINEHTVSTWVTFELNGLCFLIHQTFFDVPHVIVARFSLL